MCRTFVRENILHLRSGLKIGEKSMQNLNPFSSLLLYLFFLIFAIVLKYFYIFSKKKDSLLGKSAKKALKESYIS